MEKKVQDKIIKTFKRCGFEVLKARPGPGVPVAWPDVTAFKEGFWAVVECKAYEKSSWRPGQREKLAKLSDWSWGRAAYTENVDEICREIEALA